MHVKQIEKVIKRLYGYYNRDMINSIDLSNPVPEYEPMRQRYYYLKAYQTDS